MEDTNTNDSDEISLSEYASQLERRVYELESQLRRFTIAGPNISGNIDTGFQYSPGTDDNPIE